MKKINNKETSRNAEKCLIKYKSVDGYKYYKLTKEAKKRIADKYNIANRSFDMIKLKKDTTKTELTDSDLTEKDLKELILIEVKSSSRNDIHEDLKGYYFGYTQNERKAAEKLGENRYKITFLILPRNKTKPIGPIELTLQQMLDRTDEEQTWSYRFIK